MAWLFGSGIYTRIAGLAGLVSLALLLFLVSLDPLLRAAPLTDPGVTANTHAFSINRARKGDRLPSFATGAARSGAPASLQTRGKPPVGCDPAFSPVTSPALKHIYGRCMT